MKFFCIPLISLYFTGCSSDIPEISPVPSPIELEIQIPKTTARHTPPESAYIPILMFHHIEPVPKNHPDQIFYGLSFHPDKLEAFLQYFEANDIQTLTFDDLSAIFDGSMKLPENAVMLTFDDGYINNYNLALPLLEKYNQVGNFALIADKVPSGGFYMNEDQIKRLAQTQHICSHTLSHPNLTILSGDALEAELKDSQAYLQRITGQQVQCLVYPAGKNDTRVQAVAQEYYDWARTTTPGKIIDPNKNYELPTVRIFPTTGIASLKAWFK